MESLESKDDEEDEEAGPPAADRGEACGVEEVGAAVGVVERAGGPAAAGAGSARGEDGRSRRDAAPIGSRRGSVAATLLPLRRGAPSAVPAPVLLSEIAIPEAAGPTLHPKLAWLCGMLEATVQGDKVVVFCHFRSTLGAVCALLAAMRVGFVDLRGNRTLSKGTKALGLLQNDPSCRVLVTLYGAAAEGAEMSAANHIVLLEPEPRMQAFQQAVGRIYRAGQRKSAHVHLPFVAGGLEECLVGCLRRCLDAISTTAGAATASGAGPVRQDVALATRAMQRFALSAVGGHRRGGACQAASRERSGCRRASGTALHARLLRRAAPPPRRRRPQPYHGRRRPRRGRLLPRESSRELGAPRDQMEFCAFSCGSATGRTSRCGALYWRERKGRVSWRHSPRARQLACGGVKPGLGEHRPMSPAGQCRKTWGDSTSSPSGGRRVLGPGL